MKAKPMVTVVEVETSQTRGLNVLEELLSARVRRML